MGVLKNLGPKLQPKISDPNLTLEELDQLVAKYLEDVSVKQTSDFVWNWSHVRLRRLSNFGVFMWRTESWAAESGVSKDCEDQLY